MRKLEMEEVHRFLNVPVSMANGLRWNIQQLWSEICDGVGKALNTAGGHAQGISTDSWGVDYVLMGKGSPMLAPPFVYRDSRMCRTTSGCFGMSARSIFSATAAFSSCRSIRSINCGGAAGVAGECRGDAVDWRLHQSSGRGLSEAAEDGNIAGEHNADPGCAEAAVGRWRLISRVGLPRKIFTPVVESGTLLDRHNFR